jgi:hypothetical protein
MSDHVEVVLPTSDVSEIKLSSKNAFLGEIRTG